MLRDVPMRGPKAALSKLKSKQIVAACDRPFRSLSGQGETLGPRQQSGRVVVLELVGQAVYPTSIKARI